MTSPRIDIVIPVYNEQADLARSVRRLRSYLDERFPFTARVTIADNASTDETWAIAQRLAAELPGVVALHLAEKGRGRALRTAWTQSDAEVVAYMDVDLSTDLDALLPLVAPLLSGHSDVAIGSRLSPGSRVTRGAKREFISRSYNLLLRGVLRARFRDAQCGFKATRADVARQLLPSVADQGWFFDTELLIAAQRAGMRIHEVPVDWVDDPDSRVDIGRTARDDLRGVGRLWLDGLRGHRAVLRFLGVGVASTLAYVVLYSLLRGTLPAATANAVALLVTAVGNTAANRRFTFGVHGRDQMLRDQVVGLAAFGLALGVTSGALGLLSAVAPEAGRGIELVVLVAASVVATALRFVLLRAGIGRTRQQPAREPARIARAPEHTATHAVATRHERTVR